MRAHEPEWWFLQKVKDRYWASAETHHVILTNYQTEIDTFIKNTLEPIYKALDDEFISYTSLDQTQTPR